MSSSTLEQLELDFVTRPVGIRFPRVRHPQGEPLRSRWNQDTSSQPGSDSTATRDSSTDG